VLLETAEARVTAARHIIYSSVLWAGFYLFINSLNLSLFKFLMLGIAPC